MTCLDLVIQGVKNFFTPTPSVALVSSRSQLAEARHTIIGILRAAHADFPGATSELSAIMRLTEKDYRLCLNQGREVASLWKCFWHQIRDSQLKAPAQGYLYQQIPAELRALWEMEMEGMD